MRVHCIVCIAVALMAAPTNAADYVSIPGATFASVLKTGIENGPVTVAAFQMRVAPVTNGEFARFLDEQPGWRRDLVARTFADSSYLQNWNAPAATKLEPELAAQPVINVSWFAAQAYCESEGTRLPTWYEWEYVAAADDSRADARADPAWRERILSWYEHPVNGPPPAVGGAPNFYGVRDLHGLIWEWVEDFNALLVGADSRSQDDPDQLQFCGAGGINLNDNSNYAVLTRIALLSSLGAADTTTSLGFRCARSLSKDVP